MNTFWVVTIFQGQMLPGKWSSIEALAVNKYSAMGIEEYSLTEPEVDALLGDRSYSGGDLPEEVLDEVEESVKKGPVTMRFFFGEESDAQGFHEELGREILGETQVEEHPVEDWNAEWKKHYSPILVNDLLAVVPSWQKNITVPAREKIFINPGMGFGTGSHETTFLCLKLFTEEIKKELRTVLDFGSGSGILGLAALKFFPEAKVDLYDIDPEANENARQNAIINGLEDRSFRLLLPEVRSLLLPEYDLVFANILENILLEEKEFLTCRVKPGGFLILSGLLRHQVAGIVSAYESTIPLLRDVHKGDWSALLFRRPE